MSDRFDQYVADGRRVIALHPDHDSLDVETAASDMIATVLHGVYGRGRPGFGAQDLLDRALRCFEGDYEDMEADGGPIERRAAR